MKLPVAGRLFPLLSRAGTACLGLHAEAGLPDARVRPAIKTMISAPYRMSSGPADHEIGYQAGAAARIADAFRELALHE